MTATLRDHAKTVFRAMCCLIAASGRISEKAVAVAHFQLSNIGRPPLPAEFRKIVERTANAIHRHGIHDFALKLREPLRRVRSDSCSTQTLQLIAAVAKCSDSPCELEKDILRLFRTTLSGDEAVGAVPAALSDREIEDYAAALVQQLRLPAYVYSFDRCPPARMGAGLADDQAHFQRACLESVFQLVHAERIPEACRASVLQLVVERLKGSATPGENTTECRCISCGRPYWWELSAVTRTRRGIICPYCGVYQLAYRASTTYQGAPVWSRTTTGGPISVRACVTKKGHVRRAHTRARPRRRK